MVVARAKSDKKIAIRKVVLQTCIPLYQKIQMCNCRKRYLANIKNTRVRPPPLPNFLHQAKIKSLVYNICIRK